MNITVLSDGEILSSDAFNASEWAGKPEGFYILDDCLYIWANGIVNQIWTAISTYITVSGSSSSISENSGSTGIDGDILLKAIAIAQDPNLAIQLT